MTTHGQMRLFLTGEYEDGCGWSNVGGVKLIDATFSFIAC